MDQPAAAVPQRRCIGCGRTAAKPELLRLVAADGLAVADPAGRRPGRGAYVCRASSSDPAPACLDRAARRGALSRALRRPVRLAPGLLDPSSPATRPAGTFPSPRTS